MDAVVLSQDILFAHDGIDVVRYKAGETVTGEVARAAIEQCKTESPGRQPKERKPYGPKHTKRGSK